MLLHGIGYRHIEGIVRKRQLCRVTFKEFDAGNVRFRKRDESAVPVYGGDTRLGIPPVQRFGKRAGAAADFKDFKLRVRIQLKSPAVLFEKHVVKSEFSAEIQCHYALYML